VREGIVHVFRSARSSVLSALIMPSASSGLTDDGTLVVYHLYFSGEAIAARDFRARSNLVHPSLNPTRE